MICLCTSSAFFFNFPSFSCFFFFFFFFFFLFFYFFICFLSFFSLLYKKRLECLKGKQSILYYKKFFLAYMRRTAFVSALFFFKQKTAYEIGLGIPAEPLFR